MSNQFLINLRVWLYIAYKRGWLGNDEGLATTKFERLRDKLYRLSEWLYPRRPLTVDEANYFEQRVRDWRKLSNNE